MLSRIAMAAMAVFIIVPAGAQPVPPLAPRAGISNALPDAFRHLTPGELADAVDKSPTPVKVGFIADHENYLTEVVARTTSGTVEQHAHWIDLISVLAGEATLTYGGTYTGGAPGGPPGETRGGAMAGAQSVTLRPGDYTQIPAGLPHQMILAPGQTVRYLVVKIRQ